MSQVRHCPQCQAELPADAPAGLCPKCLIQVGFQSGAGHGSAAQTAYHPRFIAPTAEELAAYFPQLEILSKIGHGGMGVVYKARQRDLDRVVALKILRPDIIASDSAFGERFVREARALARLSHPAIVTVHDFGRRDDLYYLVMEYVDGTNLRQLEQSTALTPRDALVIVPQICDALQYAHDHGVVHRDIKPENILVDTQGRVKIADFGLAKMLGIVPEERSLTGTWQVMGTMHYMAPEQMQGTHGVDHRADIYSLGVVIYEMLTGELPVGRFPLPSQTAQVDARLDEVVLRAMERRPERRYQRASEVKTEVETITRQSNAAVREPVDRRHAATAPSFQIAQLIVGGAGVMAFLYFAIMHVPYKQTYPGNREWTRYASLTNPPNMSIGANGMDGDPISQQINWTLLAFQLGIVCAATVASILLLSFVGRRSAVPVGSLRQHEKSTRSGGSEPSLVAQVRGGWERLSDRFPRAVSTVLLVIYVASMLLFYASHGSSGPGFSRIQYEIGAFMPWYEFEFAAGKQHGFEHDYEHRFHSRFNFLSPVWFVAASAFCALYQYHGMRLRRGHKTGRWDRPSTHAVIWLVLAAIGMLLGHVMMASHLATQN